MFWSHFGLWVKLGWHVYDQISCVVLQKCRNQVHFMPSNRAKLS
jgi:hypothetical protein